MTKLQRKIVNLGNVLAISNSGYDIVEGLDIINNKDVNKSMIWINVKIEGYNKLLLNNPNTKAFSRYINLLNDAYMIYNNIIHLSNSIGGKIK